MKILVTGGSGFLGRRLARRLRERGHDVDAPTHRELDLHHAPLVRRRLAASRPDAILHLAWIATPGVFWEAGSNLEWAASSLHFLHAAHETGVRIFVGAGTCAEYAWTGMPLDEASALAAATLYGTAKAAVGMVGERYARDRAMRFAWGRVFFPYGAGELPERFVTRLGRTLARGEAFTLSEPQRRLDYIHVNDVASAFVTLLESTDAHGAFNIASGVALPMSTLARRVEAIVRPCGGASLINKASTLNAFSDVVGTNVRLQSLGWSPLMALDDGIRETLARN